MKKKPSTCKYTVKPDVIESKSSASKEKRRPFAMGGVAKIRHGEATNQGLPKSFKKKSVKECF